MASILYTQHSSRSDKSKYMSLMRVWLLEAVPELPPALGCSFSKFLDTEINPQGLDKPVPIPQQWEVLQCPSVLLWKSRQMLEQWWLTALVNPPPRWVSATKFNVLVSTRERSRRYSQNLCRTLLVKRYLFICIIYASQFFPYQECNNVPYHLIQYTTSALIRTCRAYLPHRTYSWVYITSSDQTMSAGTTYHGYLRLHSKLLAYACQQTI